MSYPETTKILNEFETAPIFARRNNVTTSWVCQERQKGNIEAVWWEGGQCYLYPKIDLVRKPRGRKRKPDESTATI